MWHGQEGQQVQNLNGNFQWVSGCCLTLSNFSTKSESQQVTFPWDDDESWCPLCTWPKHLVGIL